MPLAQLVTTYGYWAVLAGSFLEGETVVVLGGFLAHRGYLHLPLVMLAAFVGSTLGDQLAYLVGLKFGTRLIEGWRRFHSRAERVKGLIKRHEKPLLLGFRFLYGLRNVTPVVLAVSGVRPRVFIPYNLVGAAVWAALVPLGGYAFGEAFERLMVRARHYELVALVVLASVGGAIGLFVRWRTRGRPEA